MSALSVVLVLMAATAASYGGSRFWLARRFSHRMQRAFRVGLAALAAVAMLDLVRPWVFPTCLGLLIGNFISMED